MIAVLTRRPLRPERRDLPAEALQIWDSASGELVHDFGITRWRGVKSIGSLAWSSHDETQIVIQVGTATDTRLLLLTVGHVKPTRRLTVSHATHVGQPGTCLTWNSETGVVAIAYSQHIALVYTTTGQTREMPKFDLQRIDKTAWTRDWSKIAEATKVGARIYDVAAQ